MWQVPRHTYSDKMTSFFNPTLLQQVTNWLPAAVIGFPLISDLTLTPQVPGWETLSCPENSSRRRSQRTPRTTGRQVFKVTLISKCSSISKSIFNTISLLIVIEGLQVTYKPIKIWIANKSPYHNGTCFRSQAPLNTRVSSQTRVRHARHSSFSQAAWIPHSGELLFLLLAPAGA